MRVALLSALLFFMATAASAQPTERLVDAAKVFPMLDKFLAIPPSERSQLAMSYKVTSNSKPAPDVHLALVVDGRRTPLPTAPNGRVERLPTAADFAAHAQVAVQTPQGMKLGTRLDILTTIKPAKDISAADCALAIVQANAAIHRVAGVMAMLAPHISKTIFPGAGSGVAMDASGKSQPLPIVKGDPVYDPAALKDIKTLRFAQAPSSVGLD